MVFVPARLTWLLQPCDTHCFAAYKRSLQRQYHDDSVANASGTVSAKDVCLDINRAVKSVVQRKHWASAFDGNGFGASQRGVQKRVLKHLQLDEAPPISASLPTLEQFETIFPSKRAPPLAKGYEELRHGSYTPLDWPAQPRSTVQNIMY